MEIKRNSYGNLKVLIVEDDKASEILLSEFIKPFTRSAMVATSGRMAVEMCKENPDFDLILMDIRMNDGDGYEATKKIREFNQDVIIIAQTAFAVAEERQKVNDGGFNDFLAKPITKHELAWKVKSYFKD